MSLKTIRAAFRQYQQVRQLIAMADGAGFWNGIDEAAHLRYMIGPSGRKLSLRLNNMAYKSMLEACGAKENGEYLRGKASGVLETVIALDSHLPVERQGNDIDFSESDAVNTDISGLPDRLASNPAF